jgi:hypothetical protein
MSTMRWNVIINIDEDYRRTRALARLCTRDGERVGVGYVHRFPAEQRVPEIGDELAAARALDDLGNHLAAAAAVHGGGSAGGGAVTSRAAAPPVIQEPAVHDAKRWTVVVDIHDHNGAVRAVARLHDRASDRLCCEGVAYVVPVEYAAPVLGAGVATARALHRLSKRLVEAAERQCCEARILRDGNAVPGVPAPRSPSDDIAELHPA